MDYYDYFNSKSYNVDEFCIVLLKLSYFLYYYIYCGMGEVLFDLSSAKYDQNALEISWWQSSLRISPVTVLRVLIKKSIKIKPLWFTIYNIIILQGIIDRMISGH